MKVVAFNASARKDGNTAIMLKTALGELEQMGIETELVQLAGRQVRGCIACYKCYENKDGRCVVEDGIVNDAYAKMKAADGIILGSPVYFADITANMKALIERCGMIARANGNDLARKVGASVVAVRRGGAVHAFNSMNFFFTIGEMIIVGSKYWNIGIGKAPGDVMNDSEGLETMQTLGKNMGWLIQKLNG